MCAEGSSGHRLHDLGGFGNGDRGFLARACESIPVPVTTKLQYDEGDDSDTSACKRQVGAEDSRDEVYPRYMCIQHPVRAVVHYCSTRYILYSHTYSTGPPIINRDDTGPGYIVGVTHYSSSSFSITAPFHFPGIFRLILLWGSIFWHASSVGLFILACMIRGSPVLYWARDIYVFGNIVCDTILFWTRLETLRQVGCALL